MDKLEKKEVLNLWRIYTTDFKGKYYYVNAKTIYEAIKKFENNCFYEYTGEKKTPYSISSIEHIGDVID